MVAEPGPAGTARALAAKGRLLDQVLVLARRSTLRSLRQPGQVVFPLLFPLILLAVNAGGLTSATRIPGFPTSSYLAFALAVPFMQGALFASINAGTYLAIDIESGFLRRLALTPLRAPALLAGQLGGQLVIGAIGAILYICVGLAFGVVIKTGVAGALVLLALSLLVAFAFAALGALIALRLGSAEAVQGIFPLLFVTLFLSSFSLPRELIQVHWFRTIATYNPVSYLIEGLRSLIIKGWDGQALGLAFGIALVMLVAALVAAGIALRTRLVRT
ncbi:MAG TPA: ABC transporter permease [Solirubrobacteraceae bacterium]|nr:ABC transporter permease [Solirubrobacteraceae bacterium]